MAQIAKNISIAIEHLSANDVVGIPTETVYGLAGNALNESAIAKIFAVKRRPRFDPLIAHIGELSQLDSIVTHVPDRAKLLIDQFWPGPLTLLLQKQGNVPDLLTSGSERVAVRMPKHDLTQTLLRQLSFPLAAPSANPFGYVSPTTAQHVYDQLGNDIPYVLDGGPCKIGLESSIVGFEGEKVVVYRLGGLSLESIEQVVGQVELKLNKSSNPQAPGMLKSHYAPSTKFMLGQVDQMIESYGDRNIGIISFQKAFDGFPNFVLSRTGNIEEAAANLFKALREMDAADLDLILAEKVPEQGLGKAINDRLERASVR